MNNNNLIKNQRDQCIYLKIGMRNFIVLIFIDGILLESNHIDMIHESNHFISYDLNMKDLAKALYSIGLKMHRDITQSISTCCHYGFNTRSSIM